MAATQRREALKVEIPKDDAPKLGRVGIIAAVGFAIGAFWPTLAGVKLVPSVPSQPAAAPGLAGEPVAASALSALPPTPAPAAAPAPPEEDGAANKGPTIGTMQVTSCRAK